VQCIVQFTSVFTCFLDEPKDQVEEDKEDDDDEDVEKTKENKSEGKQVMSFILCQPYLYMVSLIK